MTEGGKTWDEARHVPGESVTLTSAVMSMLPETGAVEVQRDTPGREHPPHTHESDETLLIVEGEIAFTAGDVTARCTSGDRLLLRRGTKHSSIAGPVACT